MTKTKHNKRISPNKLSKKSHIRVIAPSRSLGVISKISKESALRKLEKFGFTISFGKHSAKMDQFNSSSIKSRIEDLHDSFEDDRVDAVLSVIGGYNSNQLLQYIDYELIERNPKIFCGFSDITVLSNAITAITGLITYSGPHFSSWGMKYGFEYSLEYFMKCCMSDSEYELIPSKEWSDDSWYLNQEKRKFTKNEGYWILNKGEAFGQIVGGHMRCLGALQGTQFWPGLDNSILILEEDAETNPQLFDRGLQSLIHQPDFFGVKGILIGRFQKMTEMTRELLQQIVDSKSELRKLPIIANIDFGHTTPMATFPIGGILEMSANENAKIKIIKH